MPNILNTIIENNSAQSGGGIVCWYNSSPVLQNVSFNHNSVNWGGGGIRSHNSNLQIDNCTFNENTAGNGGGAINFQNDVAIVGNIFELHISENSFIGNQSQTDGGGICIKQWNDTTVTSVILDKCEFIENSADYHSGLKIRGNVSDLQISNCIFSGNEAVRFTGACSFTSYASGQVFNCLFVSNTAATGGGNWDAGGVSVYTESSVDFMNCTFADNSAS